MPRPSGVTIVLGVVCLGALSIVTNIATGALPMAWSPLDCSRTGRLL
jgi:hypothetical protein